METQTTEQQFVDWVRRHPEIYAHFADLALAARRTGRRRIGAKLLVEMVRWQHGVSIPNNYATYLGRLAMSLEPELAGFFTVSKRRSNGTS